MADAIVLDIGIEGECQLEGYEGKITLLSYNHGMTQPMQFDPSNSKRTVGRMDCQEISVTKALDKATPTIIDKMCTAGLLDACTLYVLKAASAEGSGQVLALQYEMENAMISSYSVGGGGGGEPTETLTLNFTKITWTYSPQAEDGSISGNLPTNWNLATGKKD